MPPQATCNPFSAEKFQPGDISTLITDDFEKLNVQSVCRGGPLSAVYINSKAASGVTFKRFDCCNLFSVYLVNSDRHLPTGSASPPLLLSITGLNSSSVGESSSELFTAIFDFNAITNLEINEEESAELETVLTSRENLFIARDTASLFIETATRHGRFFHCFTKPIGATVDLNESVNSSESALGQVTEQFKDLALDTSKVSTPMTQSEMNRVENIGRDQLTAYFRSRRAGVVIVRQGLNFGVTKVWTCFISGFKCLTSSSIHCADCCPSAEGGSETMSWSWRPICGLDVQKLELLAQEYY